MATSPSSAATEPLACDAASAATAVELIMPTKRATRVDWAALKRISEIVQGDLDDADELDDADDYDSVYAMWQRELKDLAHGEEEIQQESQQESQELPDGALASAPAWYASANDYWQDEAKCSLDDNGVLGGFAHISPADVADSREFIFKLALKRPQWKRDAVVDCGAGIGRVTKHLLMPLFKHVDLVEQSERLLRGVPAYVAGSSAAANGKGRGVRHLYCMGLQDFEPTPRSYDLIWIQWVSSHLTDLDFVRFLQRCKSALAPHGWIAVKENVLLAGSPYEIDRQDSSMTRSDVYFKSIFRQSGLDLVAEQTQRNFPEELYPVKMYALA